MGRLKLLIQSVQEMKELSRGYGGVSWRDIPIRGKVFYKKTWGYFLDYSLFTFLLPTTNPDVL
jgi:hypothetical protein